MHEREFRDAKALILKWAKAYGDLSHNMPDQRAPLFYAVSRRLVKESQISLFDHLFSGALSFELRRREAPSKDDLLKGVLEAAVLIKWLDRDVPNSHTPAWERLGKLFGTLYPDHVLENALSVSIAHFDEIRGNTTRQSFAVKRLGKWPWTEDEELAEKKERKRLAKERQDAIAGIRQAVSELEYRSDDAESEPVVLSDRDIELAFRWSRDSQSDLSGAWKQFAGDRDAFANSLGRVAKKEAARVVSARLAELSVTRYFGCHGYKVRDVSIEQLRNTDSGLWQQCDLELDGEEKIDVKHVRCHGDHIWGRILVGPHKPHRLPDVLVAGTISRYASLEELFWGTAEIPRFLGCIDGQSLANLSAEFGDDLLRLGNLRVDSRNQWLPPWAFSPYKGFRPRHLEQAERIMDEVTKLKLPPSDLSIGHWMLLASYSERAADFLGGVPVPLRQVAHRMSKGLRDGGWSLAFVVLSIMSDFKRSIDRRHISAAPSMYYALIHLPKPAGASEGAFESNWVLGMPDVTQSVYRLIEALQVLWDYANEHCASITDLTMPRPGILKGSINAGPSRTLVAYCGGCARYPLVFGREDSCPKLKLVCACGYCCHECLIA